MSFVIPGYDVAVYAHHAGFSGGDLVTAVAVARAESSCDASAENKNTNGSTDYGLWQINSVHKGEFTSDEWERRKRPEVNAMMAYKIYKAAGNKFTPWTTFTSGSYKKQLEKATKDVVEFKKRGPDHERKVIGYQGGQQIVDAVDGVKDTTVAASTAVPEAVNAFGRTVKSVANNALLVAVALVFIVLGVIILARAPIGALVGNSNPVGRAAALARKVG